jgi:arginyl-tRNA synthetase
MTDFKKKIAEILGTLLDIPEDEIVDSLEIPPDSAMGDFAYPCFSAAKKLKKNPAMIASEITRDLQKSDFIEKIEQKGPYVNFFLDKGSIAKAVLHAKSTQHVKKQTILIESPGPNTNKPLHLGHIRNGLLGLSLRNILKKNGYTVHNVDIINDRGIHIAKSMLAYQMFGNGEKPTVKTDHFVGKYYVLFNTKASEHPEMEQAAQALLRKWEDGDKKTIELWKTMNTWCIQGMQETYKKLGLIIDRPYYESEHYKEGKQLIMEGLKKGIFSRDEDGSICIDLTDEELDKKVLLRADGTSVYITQDIALAKKRFDDYHMDRMIYVVGNEQEYHFKVLFKVLKKMGFSFADQCFHLSYGMVNLPEGKMKSREGTIVDADDFIESITQLAEKEIAGRHPGLGKSEGRKRAEKIALGAIKFFMLKYDPAKDFVYNPKDSLSFEGETGPYIQYTHARICSILRKYGSTLPKAADYKHLTNDEEKQLLQILMDYEGTILAAAEHYKPSLITRYLLDLSQAFNNYYHKHQVLKEEAEIRDARILLLMKIKEVLHDALTILSIEPLEEM